MDAIPAVVSAHELTRTFGVLLIGFIFTVVLYGLTFFQTYVYFTHFPCDNWGTKFTVGVLWAADTASTTLISHTIYLYLITSFMLTFEQLETTRTFIAEEALGAFVMLIVQVFYAYRVWSVTDRRIVLPVVIVALAMAACALNLAGVAQIYEQKIFVDIVTSRVKLLRGVGSALAVATNFSIVGSMFYHMKPERNPGMALPDGVFEKMVVYCFNRGTVFAAMQVICMIFFLAIPKEQGWILLNWVAVKVYVNSILAMLNFRNTHRGRGVNEEDSLNQHASSNSASGAVGPRETARSVQFSVDPDAKTGDPRNIIELDMVPSRMEGYDDDSGKNGSCSVDTDAPNKRRESDDESR